MDLRDFERLVRPLKTRLASMIVRGVVELVDDSKRLQLLQIGGFEGGPLDDGEHFQQYGFSSNPLPGAEVVAIFPNGDRAHPLIVAGGDRRTRPTGGDPGDVTLYHYAGAKIRLLESGDVEVSPGPSGKVYARTEGGGSEPLVTVSQFNAHTHPVSTTGSSSAQTGTAAAPTPAAGTSVFEAE